MRIIRQMALIQLLEPGPLDVVGDVHGEIGALLSVMDRLGYSYDGSHAEGRRLVFVGDLVDRGPDSIAVVQVVKHMVQHNKAYCVLGNHELNILLGERKHGNRWYWGEEEVLVRDGSKTSLARLADESFRKEFVEFAMTLPLVLEREDVRIVHACWDSESIQMIRSFEGNVIEAYEHFRNRISERIIQENILDPHQKELYYQNYNPVKVVTSGKEQLAAERYYAGGRWRDIERCRWWEMMDEYNPNNIIVFGHYWRKIHSKEDIFRSTSWLLPNHSVCIDYSVGIRYEERAMNLNQGSLGTCLAALRLPEGTFFSDHLDKPEDGALSPFQ